MRDETEQKRDETDPRIQSHCDQITQRHRTTRQSSLRQRPGPSRAGDFQTKRPASPQARNVAPLGNTRDTILPEFSAAILLHDKLADKQKSSLPAPEK